MSASTILAVGAVAAVVGGAVYIATKKDDKAASKPSDDLNVSDACEASLDKLPEPFHSMLLSPSTDLSDPAVVESIAKQLDKAGFSSQAACMRKFAPAIVAEHGVTGEDISDNCGALIDADDRFNDSNAAIMKNAVKTGSREQLLGLAAAARPVNAKLANCIDAVAKSRASGTVALDKGTIDMLNGVAGEGAKPMSAEFDALHKALV